MKKRDPEEQRFEGGWAWSCGARLSWKHSPPPPVHALARVSSQALAGRHCGWLAVLQRFLSRQHVRLQLRCLPSPKSLQETGCLFR